jgi:hypothetical protein
MRIFPVVMVGAVLMAASSGNVLGGAMYPRDGRTGEQAPQVTGSANTVDQDHPAESKPNPQLSEKQRRLVEQTDKLVQLATDLKAQVDKSTKDTLSIQVIKKADEIEKLAHSMKDQMKS